MYIILGEEHVAFILWYRRGVWTLIMYSIIIADIAPRIPGDLMHFNLIDGPGCYEISPYTRFITRPTIIWLNHARVVKLEMQKMTQRSPFSLGYTKKSIFIRLIMMMN